MNVLLDSDIVIEVQRARDIAILESWTDLSASENAIFYSPVTSAEVWAGARPDEFVAINRFFAPLLCAPADYETGKLAGEFLREFGKSHGLQIADALIAASAVQLQAALWTRNHRHYPMKTVSFFPQGVR